jgi:hypothetical protein
MKRLIITESERKKILNMHGLKKMLSESTIVDVQNLLNTKFSAGLKPDNKYGPLTIAAIEKALSGGGPEFLKTIDLTTKPLDKKSTEDLTKPVTLGTPAAPAAAGTTAGEPAADKGEDSSVPA